jgi:hypothetical protein
MVKELLKSVVVVVTNISNLMYSVPVGEAVVDKW